MKNVLLYWSQSHEAGVGALREGHSSFDTCRHKETHITVILKRYPIIIKNDPKNIYREAFCKNIDCRKASLFEIVKCQ